MLHKRGSVYHVKFKAGGVTYQKSTRTSSLRKAQEFERQLREFVARELHAQRTGIPVERTYEEAVNKWLESGAPESMNSHARNTLLYLADTPLHLVVPAAHQMKAALIKRKLSVMTINRRLAVVRRILNLAYAEWDWTREPLGKKIKLLSEKGTAREMYLSRTEADQLLGFVENEEARKVILLAAYTGLRRGEILRLRPENWKSPYITLSSNTKSKRPRTVPVIESLQACVTLPFKISEYELRAAFEKARDAMGRPDIRFHDLRHTYASWLASNPDVPLTVIRDLLGHSNLGVTSKYAHLRGNNYALIEGALGGKG
jgi:integrase